MENAFTRLELLKLRHKLPTAIRILPKLAGSWRLRIKPPS
jgi:hypothetical protein